MVPSYASINSGVSVTNGDLFFFLVIAAFLRNRSRSVANGNRLCGFRLSSISDLFLFVSNSHV